MLMQLNFTVPGGQGDPIPETDEASIVLVSFVLKAMYMVQIMKDSLTSKVVTSMRTYPRDPCVAHEVGIVLLRLGRAEHVPVVHPRG